MNKLMLPLLVFYAFFNIACGAGTVGNPATGEGFSYDFGTELPPPPPVLPPENGMEEPPFLNQTSGLSIYWESSNQYFYSAETYTVTDVQGDFEDLYFLSSSANPLNCGASNRLRYSKPAGAAYTIDIDTTDQGSSTLNVITVRNSSGQVVAGPLNCIDSSANRQRLEDSFGNIDEPSINNYSFEWRFL